MSDNQNSHNNHNNHNNQRRDDNFKAYIEIHSSAYPGGDIVNRLLVSGRPDRGRTDENRVPGTDIGVVCICNVLDA